MIDTMTLYSRQRGTLPDRYWNQLNGRTAMENYNDFKSSQIQNREPEEPELHIRVEVKKK